MNITDISYGLTEIMNLHPVSYNMISDSRRNCIGFIAQEVNEFIPELVSVDNDMYSLNYSGFSPVIVKAIQEQQSQINTLTEQVNTLQNQNELLNNTLSSLMSRIESLESK